ncbi:hypothetical protein BDR04DRAFT_1095717 [Suillus decipiens]|nr:hypothetical protein BDR04DRAFT_1095717 [Suillus decipiens]
MIAQNPLSILLQSPGLRLQFYNSTRLLMRLCRCDTSFADCVVPSRPVEPLNVTDMAPVPYTPSTAAAEIPEQAKPLRENIAHMEKKSKRKNVMRGMSLLAPRTSGTKAHRFSVPVFSSLSDGTSKRASKRP